MDITGSVAPQLIINSRDVQFCPVLVSELTDIELIITEQTPVVELIIDAYAG
jgi:hypothetical protein